MGSELKRGLRAVSDEWQELDQKSRRRRAFALGSYPLPLDPPVLHDLWKMHMSPWRGDRPSGNLLTDLSEKEAQTALDEARELMGVAGGPFGDSE